MIADSRTQDSRTQHSITDKNDQPLRRPPPTALTRSIIRAGSKTFSFASIFFDSESRTGAHLLYTFCRICDDAIDKAGSKAEASANLRYLFQHLQTSDLSQPNREFLDSQRPNLNVALECWYEIEEHYFVPRTYAIELLRGLEMDCEGFRPATVQELLLYCYRVAGVVGLMMAHVMGVRSKQALEFAIDTGTAMQLTNSTRDLKEDFQMGRSYIPLAWDDSPNRTVFDENRAMINARLLMQTASVFFASGRRGLPFLPFRARLAVAIAQMTYHKIGTEVLRRGRAGVQRRVILSMAQRFELGFSECVRWSAQALFDKFWQLFKPVPLFDESLPVLHSPDVIDQQLQKLGLKKSRSTRENDRTEDTPNTSH